MTNALTEKMAKMNIDELAEIVGRLMNDTSSEATMVIDAALSAIESKMPEADFVRFCEKL
jgi:hypothetical protein